MPLRLDSPYRARGCTWLRGNLHTHTTVSDGQNSPEETLAAYEARGYDFLAISDHDRLVPSEDYRTQTKLLLLSAVEVSARGPHLLAVDIRGPVTPEPDRQQVIDAVNAQGGFCILNHPSWLTEYSHWPQEQMERLTGYAGIEIYNGVVEWLEGSALATDRWDRLLSAGRRVWGYAHDDLHHPHNIACGWNVVQATARSVKAVSAALRAGRFYASTGVEIKRITVEGPTVTLDAPTAQRIRFIGSWGRQLALTDGGVATYTATGQEGGYVRAECLGAGGRVAWTQPFFAEETPAGK